MKILISSLFVAFVLILGSFQANAKWVLPQERQLFNDANLGRKVSAGPNDKFATDSKGVENLDTKTKNGADTAVNGELNENNDGEDSGSASHRYFSDDERQPKNNKIHTPHPSP